MLATAVALLAFSVFGFPVAAGVGAALLIALGLAFAHTAPLARRTRRDGIEFFWHVHRVHPWRSGPLCRTVEIRMRFANPSFERLNLARMVAMLPTGLRQDLSETVNLELEPQQRGELRLELTAFAPGRYVLPGLAVERAGIFGLFHVALYFPSPLEVISSPYEGKLGLPFLPSGGNEIGYDPKHRLREGEEWRELREMHSTDSLRKIAWRASARRGRWLVRETEEHTRAQITLELNADAQSRTGAMGLRELDFAVHRTSEYARRLLRAGYAVGLQIVDEDKRQARGSRRVLAKVAPEHGSTQHARIVAALIDAMHPVDADLTAFGQAEVVDAIGHYLRRQENIDCVAQGAHGALEWDVRTMVEQTRRLLRQDETRFSTRFLGAHTAVRIQGETPSLTVLRRFCKARGIDLGYR